MAPTNPTEPGWYPDPWGTGGERRYDGHAWGRETRPGPGAPAPDPATSAAGTAPGTPADPTVAGAPSGPLPPAAWYPDPAGSGGLRYWDGTVWTAHTAYTDGPAATAAPRADLDPARLLASAQSLARSLRVLLLFAGPALAIQIVTSAISAHRWGPMFREVLDNPEKPLKLDPPSFVLSMTQNVASMVFLATGLIFILWLGTAGKLILAKGLPQRRSPWVGAWSFIIPIVNYWWPYRATKDLLGGDPTARPLVARWWTLWILVTALQLVSFWVTAFGAAEAVIVVVVSVTAAVSIAAALAARAVVAAVMRTHEQLVGAPAQA